MADSKPCMAMAPLPPFYPTTAEGALIGCNADVPDCAETRAICLTNTTWGAAWIAENNFTVANSSGTRGICAGHHFFGWRCDHAAHTCTVLGPESTAQIFFWCLWASFCGLGAILATVQLSSLARRNRASRTASAGARSALVVLVASTFAFLCEGGSVAMRAFDIYDGRDNFELIPLEGGGFATNTKNDLLNLYLQTSSAAMITTSALSISLLWLDVGRRSLKLRTGTLTKMGKYRATVYCLMGLCGLLLLLTFAMPSAFGFAAGVLPVPFAFFIVVTYLRGATAMQNMGTFILDEARSRGTEGTMDTTRVQVMLTRIRRTAVGVSSCWITFLICRVLVAVTQVLGGYKRIIPPHVGSYYIGYAIFGVVLVRSQPKLHSHAHMHMHTHTHTLTQGPIGDGPCTHLVHLYRHPVCAPIQRSGLVPHARTRAAWPGAVGGHEPRVDVSFRPTRAGAGGGASQR